MEGCINAREARTNLDNYATSLLLLLAKGKKHNDRVSHNNSVKVGLMEYPEIYKDVSNWWYHYYVEGYNDLIREDELNRFHFLRNISQKITPNFDEYRYDCGLCHPQIGIDEKLADRKSIVLLKTAIGTKNPQVGYVRTTPYVTGFYRVKKVQRGIEPFNHKWSRDDPRRRDWYIEMDKNCALLLLDSPIEIDKSFAKKLWPKLHIALKKSQTWAQFVGSRLRHTHADIDQVKAVVSELWKRWQNRESENYLGNQYSQLLKAYATYQKKSRIFSSERTLKEDSRSCLATIQNQYI